MSWPEILIIIAGAVMLFILIRRLPATSETKEQNMKNINKKNSKLVNLFKPLRQINWLFWQKKNKISVEEDLATNVKKPEDKAFWVEGQKGSGEGAAHLIANTYFDQAEEAFSKKDYRKAETLYIQAARENPKNIKIFNRLGVIYLETKNFADAIEAFSTTLRYDSSVGSRHFNLGVAYLGMGDNEKAKKCIREAIKLCPGNEKYQKVLDDLEKK